VSSPLLAAAALPADPWFHGTPLTILALALALVALNGFFVAAEFSLVKVRPTQVSQAAEAGQRRARVAYHMIHHLDSYLSATQLGITLASLGLGWIGEPAFTWLLEPAVRFLTGGAATPRLAHSIGLAASFLVITMLHVVLGELTPKWLAIRDAESVALWVAFPLFAFHKVAYPAIWVLSHASNGLLRVFGIAPVREGETVHDEEELRRLLASSHSSHVSPHKRELLDNIFELSHRVARQIMLPRQDVVYLSTTRPLEENLRLARRSGHTRLPLCRGDLDHVIGVVHIKDLFRLERPVRSLEEVAREITFVPETLELDRLLKRMLAERFHLAAVIDEYGGVSGIVTMEAVIEEIVGQIEDEFDVSRPELSQEPDGSYLISGGMLLEDLEDALKLELSERDEDTIGGVVLSELGRNPAVGDTVPLGPIRLEVREVQGNRITMLRGTVEKGAAIPTAVVHGNDSRFE
jgi:CBS domain containing-hemolysin-like protein